MKKLIILICVMIPGPANYVSDSTTIKIESQALTTIDIASILEKCVRAISSYSIIAKFSDGSQCNGVVSTTSYWGQTLLLPAHMFPTGDTSSVAILSLNRADTLFYVEGIIDDINRVLNRDIVRLSIDSVPSMIPGFYGSRPGDMTSDFSINYYSSSATRDSIKCYLDGERYPIIGDLRYSDGRIVLIVEYCGIDGSCGIGFLSNDLRIHSIEGVLDSAGYALIEATD